MQKDLRQLTFSYTHVESLNVDRQLLRRILADPVLGRRVFADGRFEQGQLVEDLRSDAQLKDLAKLLGPEDVVLVTGGARGIAASIVQSLLPVVDARFILVGRNPQVADWIVDRGTDRIEYLAADVCDSQSVADLKLGEKNVTLVIHAAGLGAARPIREIRREEMASILGVKILGIENILCDLDRSQLRGIVNFSSINAVFGGDGHPDYSAGNAYLDGFTCGSVPVLSIGWTAWDEVGMAIGAIDSPLPGNGRHRDAAGSTKVLRRLAGCWPTFCKQSTLVRTAWWCRRPWEQAAS